MFDWNHEEFTNIIWGETEEGGDHIVPHPNANQEKHSDILRNHVKNETNKECVDLKPKESILQNTSHVIKAESCMPDRKARYSLDVVPDTILTLCEKVTQDSEGIETYNKVCDISRHEHITEVETASEIFQSPLKESEQSDFVDYGWASVGSFDDLDRIFSNEDPIHGNASLGIAEDMWTSCRDGTSTSEKSCFLKDEPRCSGISPLRTKAEQFAVEADFFSDENQSLTPCYGKFSAFAARASRDSNWFNGNAGSSNRENHLFKDKTSLETDQSDCIGCLPDITPSDAETNEYMDKKKILQSRKTLNEDSSFHGLEQGIIGQQNRSIHSHNPYTPAMVAFPQQMPCQVPTPSQLKHMSSSSPLIPIVNGNVANGYAVLPSLSPFHSMGVGLQPRNVSRYDQSHEMPCRTMPMTPQEKIEKLRRKQQMRAMLAIQKQQRQFGSSTLEGENIDSCLDLNFPVRQDLLNNYGMVIDEGSTAERILYQLQDTISKLDIQVRLSMRDSLYRLANSASKRRYANEESNVHISFPETGNVEIETNPIDRTVAHMLFYQPMESPGKHVETKVVGFPYDINSTGSKSSPADYFQQKSKSKQIYYYDDKA